MVLQRLHATVTQYRWYMTLDPVRQSVVLTWPTTTGSAAARVHADDRRALDGAAPVCAPTADLKDSKAAKKLPGRYDMLEKLLLTGELVA